MSFSRDIVKLDGLSESLWLVKIPKAVAEKWSEAEDHEELGRLTISKSGVKNSQNLSSKKLSISLNNDDNEGLKDFLLEEIGGDITNDKKVIAFSYDQSNSQYELSGKCTKSYYMKPQDNPQYHKILRKRNEVDKSRRESQYVDPSILLSMPSSSSYVIDLSSSVDGNSKRRFGSENNESTNPNKSSRYELDHTSLRSKVFELFSKDSKLTSNEILRECKDIAGITKENLLKFLKLYCSQDSKGTFKHHWELKNEYQSNSK